MRDGLNVAIELERWDDVGELGRECHDAQLEVWGPKLPEAGG